MDVRIATDIEIENNIEVNSVTTNTQIISVELPLYPIEKSDPVLPHRSSLSPLFNIQGLQPISPTTEEEYYSKQNVKLKLELKCKDILGKEHSFKSDLDVSALACRILSQE